MFVYFLIFLGALLRVAPHPANFAPIAALALFGSVYLNRKVALVVPLAAMVISDFFIGFDSLGTRLIVYGAFLGIAAMGLWVRNHKNVYTITSSAVLGSVIFFLVTNLPFVHPNSLYPYTVDGTVTSYINGLPFFKYTLIGDLFYTAVFFGAYEAVLAWQKKKELNHAHKGQSSS